MLGCEKSNVTLKGRHRIGIPNIVRMFKSQGGPTPAQTTMPKSHREDPKSSACRKLMAQNSSPVDAAAQMPRRSVRLRDGKCRVFAADFQLSWTQEACHFVCPAWNDLQRVTAATFQCGSARQHPVRCNCGGKLPEVQLRPAQRQEHKDEEDAAEQEVHRAERLPQVWPAIRRMRHMYAVGTCTGSWVHLRGHDRTVDAFRLDQLVGLLSRPSLCSHEDEHHVGNAACEVHQC